VFIASLRPRRELHLDGHLLFVSDRDVCLQQTSIDLTGYPPGSGGEPAPVSPTAPDRLIAIEDILMEHKRS
jgi:hypothetical protein